MRRRVCSLTAGLPLSARETVGCETPASCAMSNEVGLRPILPLSVQSLAKPRYFRVFATFQPEYVCVCLLQSWCKGYSNCRPVHLKTGSPGLFPDARNHPRHVRAGPLGRVIMKAIFRARRLRLASGRTSLENSIAAKRESNFIVDIVTADDIAGLPDVSTAESLARLPGVTSQRTGGQASAINIRGLSQDLVSATLNGREQVATSGNRVIEFDQYPSELINQAAVYKTPLASHIEGGIAGKVELKTVRPLDNADAFKATVNLRGLYNDRASESPDVSSYGYRVSGSVQAKLLDDTLGIALGYARLYQPNVATRFVQFDFPIPGTNGSPTRDLN